MKKSTQKCTFVGVIAVIGAVVVSGITFKPDHWSSNHTEVYNFIRLRKNENEQKEAHFYEQLLANHKSK